MKINVTCEKHNVSMVVVREWSSRGDIEVTVEPCSECIEEAVQRTGLDAACDFPGCEDLGIIWVCANHATPSR